MAQDAYFFANTRSYPRVSRIQIVLELRILMFSLELPIYPSLMDL